MTDSYIDELAAIRREQSSNLPAELADDPTFMAVRECARHRLTSADLELFDVALALAYSCGRVHGAKVMVAALTAAASATDNVVRLSPAAIDRRYPIK